MDPPMSTIDICCGSCNLLYAVKNRWKNTCLFGVDIAKQKPDGVSFTNMDGRDYAIRSAQKYPLIVANPPFVRLTERGAFPELFEGLFQDVETSRLEIEMLIANLQLLDDNGKLLVIMPNTFVEGDRCRGIRKTIGTNYKVEHIIRLPDDTFGSTGIKSYAIVISRQPEEKVQTCVSEMYGDKDSSSYTISKTESISFLDIRDGKWTGENTCIAPDLKIRRGNISSEFFISDGIPVLHTAKLAAEWKPSVRYVNELTKNPVYAADGDIIISRIGKSAGCWCVYSGERTAISDCLYCFEKPSNTVLARIEGKKFDKRQRGVATRYITKNDFVSWMYSFK